MPRAMLPPHTPLIDDDADYMPISAARHIEMLANRLTHEMMRLRGAATIPLPRPSFHCLNIIYVLLTLCCRRHALLIIY